MLALGIDTSTPVVSVAVVASDVVVARRDALVNNKHGEVLAGLIDQVFREAGASVADVASIGVGLGPGPFTGLRVGVVTAAAMSDALGVPAYGMCSLDVVGSLHATDGAPFLVVSDARRRQLYWAVYDEAGRRVEGPEIGSPPDVAAHVRGRVSKVAGPASTLYADAFSGFRVAEPCWPDAAWLATDAWRKHDVDADPELLTPMYLRRPDAREPGPPKRVTPT